MSVGGACAADFCAGLGVLAWSCPLGETLQAAPINITDRAAVSDSTKWRVRGTTTRPVATLNVTCVIPSSIC